MELVLHAEKILELAIFAFWEHNLQQIMDLPLRVDKNSFTN